ncbi:acyl transferase/acyl hydrolase/lysophospholipase [Cokeromyces recurvatus]|uniref:acyl transferase/acyl hydrolase/lysophospholipase n=1 Tax=Cokeromyces recurvatus TaxID=90255 RepID=UPI00221F6B96|nr:acyl transferase/acyl hydrolase/lysophospholipase [Cokeromyces recurvatus]KAI7900709.1 acyl transferase/acyl hydrolase/lysophospholipase [Cokeromyces recurvatus]
MIKNSDKAIKKTTNKIINTADDSGTRSLDGQQNNDLYQEYVNETHVADFIKALSYDPIHEYISAWTDALPVSKRTSKRKLKEQEAAKPKGISYLFLRYPFILFAYILLRQVVCIWENLFSWRGKKRTLRNKLRASKTYKEWCESADALDKYMHKDEWKNTIPYAYYDYRLLQKVVKHLKMYRKGDTPEDATKLMDVLYVCLKQNFAGIENVQLYSNSYLGTKSLIEEYIEEVTRSIEFLQNNKYITNEEKRLAFKLYSKNYGRTAFCLSGGAGFGYYHLGVIRALVDRGLLPSIITGTSAGSLMGAIVCTRTDEELNSILTPELANRIHICHESWKTKLTRFVTTGALFDSAQWCREAMWFCKGSVTFKEAYEKTGRIFNISVIPYDPHSPPKLLNYITAPDCVIWSAILASSAIPGILNPVVLMQKKQGSDHLVPYNYGHKFKDGSLSTDIPTHALNTQFNVNYTIVSQVNPHVHLFFYANQGSPGRPVTHLQGHGWRGGFLASTIEQTLKLDLSKWLKVLKSLKLLPKVRDQDWSSLWLQKFDGNVTILPKSTLSDWFYIIADPSEDRLRKLMQIGQIRTWPKISIISNRLRIESAIEKARKSFNNSRKSKKRLSKDKSSIFDGNNKNDYSSSGDELLFISRRRVSIPDDGSLHTMEDKDYIKEQNRRRKFMAQFVDSSHDETNDSTQNSLIFESFNGSQSNTPLTSSHEDDDDDDDDEIM